MEAPRDGIRGEHRREDALDRDARGQLSSVGALHQLCCLGALNLLVPRRWPNVRANPRNLHLLCINQTKGPRSRKRTASFPARAT